MPRPLVPILLLALAAAGYYGWRQSQPSPPAAPGNALTLYGNIDLRTLNLGFEASGRVVAMHAQEGARVAAGSLLAELDPRRLTLLRDEVAAKLKAAEAQHAELVAGTRHEELAQLRAELAAARISATNAGKTAARLRNLARDKLTTQQQADDARSSAEAAEAHVTALEAQLDLAEAGARRETIAASEANLVALRADLDLAEYNLEQTRLLAPAASVVQSRLLEPGDLASTTRPAYTLALTEPLWARVYLPGPRLGQIHPGQPAQLYSDSFPGKAYHGWVGYISPSAEFTPKSVQTSEVRADLVYQVRIFVCDPSDELRLGMPVTVTLDPDAPTVRDPGCPRGE